MNGDVIIKNIRSLKHAIVMKYSIFIVVFLLTWVVDASAQLKVDSLGNTILSKKLSFAEENGGFSSQSLFSKDSNIYWAENGGWGGLKMTMLGKLFLNPADFGLNNIFNTEIDYTFDPPYVNIYPYNSTAALTIRSGACRPVHAILGDFNGGPHEGIRSDVYDYHDKPFVAYAVTTVSELDKPTSMQVFSVNGSGLVYGMSGFSQASDGRLKKDVHNLSSGMGRINALRGVSFHYKSTEKAVALATQANDTVNKYISEDVKRQIEKEESMARIGFIAQEVENVVPEVVRTLPDGTKTIIYTDLIPLLVEGMKEMQETIVEQEKRIAELETALLSDKDEKLKGISAHSLSSEDSSGIQSIEEAVLYQNVPNPFTHTTEIAYRLSPKAHTASIGIYDLNGKQLKRYSLQPSVPVGKVEVNASELVPGMYIYALVIDGTMLESKRMIIE